MKRIMLLLSALILVPALSSAQRRVSTNRASGGSGQSYKTTYNHAAPAQSAPGPRAFVTTPHHSAPAQAGASSRRAAPTRAFRGGSGGSFAPRNSQSSSWLSNYGSRPLSRSRGMRRADDEGGEGAPADPGNGRTYLNTPGALIRTEGLGARVEAAPPARLHEIEGGGRIAADERYAQNQTNHKGLFVGPRDTPPNPNPGFSGGVSGNTAITPNSPSGAGHGDDD